ncbi:MAG: PKD domain-containing protein [Candidatus Niyogibacteria bacterium]|nr:PKD domain-containing protein [Candidatus Niyogibacteria bacterium]
MRSGIFVFLVLFLPFTAIASSHIANFEFITLKQSIAADAISDKITVQLRDSAGEPAAAGQTSCLQLISASASGEFSSSAENWGPVNILTMNSNWTSRSFYYRDSSAGIPTITVHLALKPVSETRSCSNWPPEEWVISWTAKQQINIGELAGETEPAESQQSQTVFNAESSSSASVSGPEFKAKIIGGDKTAILGAQINFEGAFFGLEGKPIEKADFLWSFGDGTTARGRLANHTYNYPGKYIVYLNAAISGVSSNDAVIVDVIPNEVKISEVKPSAGGWIEIFNGSNFKMDLSYWAVSNGKMVFYFPKNTFMEAKTFLVIPENISGIEFFENGRALLLYPRGDAAYEFVYAGLLKGDESWHFADGAAKAGLESPGSAKFTARISLKSESAVAAANGEEEKEPFENQLAASGISQETAKNARENNGWIWFGSALALGVLSAVGLLMVRRGSS